MKQIASIIAGLLIMSFASTSCTKNYTCVCVYPGSNIGATNTTIKAKKRSDAQATCESQHRGAQATGGSCALQ